MTLRNKSTDGFWYATSYGISVLFHPALIPTLIIFMLYVADYPMFTSGIMYWHMILKTFLTTGLIPAISIYMMYRMRFLKSLHLENRQERQLPFAIMSIFYSFVTIVYVFSQQGGLEFILILSGVSLSVLVVTFITKFHKISVHTVGVSGMLGSLVGLQWISPIQSLLYPILFSIFMTGIVMSARLKLNAHTPLETFTGLFVGFWICFGVLYFSSWIL